MNSRRISVLSSVAVLVALLTVSLWYVGTSSASAAVTETGNGAPSGAHYNLNIIGVPKDKSADMTGNNGHRMFVKPDGKTRIKQI